MQHWWRYSALQLGYLFDHPGTVLFSVFMSFWAVTFLEYWKRKMATLAHHWDCMDFHEEEVSQSFLSFLTKLFSYTYCLLIKHIVSELASKECVHWCWCHHCVPQERPRPEFAAMAPTMEPNPVTGVKEPYFPEKTRLARVFTGSMVIIMMVRYCSNLFVLSILAAFAVTLYYIYSLGLSND